MLSLPSSLLRAPPPPSRLSAHFAFRLIEPTLLLSFPPGTRRVSPVDPMPLYPCRCCYPATALVPLLPLPVPGCCLHLQYRGSASGNRFLRGYICIHFRYDPGSCSPRYTGLRRWASESNVSITSCYPSYMAPASTMTGLPPVRVRHPSLGTPRVKT